MLKGSGDPDVLVVGGGPAGSTVAGLLARRGWSVTLVDRARFPRPKPCGECVTPGGVAALERLGLLPAVRALDPTPLEGWEIGGAGSAPAVGTFAPRARPGLAVDRRSLDAALLDEARGRGVLVEEGVQVVDAGAGADDGSPPWVRTRERDGREGRRTARVLVGADGLRSVVSRSVGPGPRAPGLRKLSLTAHVAPPPGGATPLTSPGSRGRLVLTDRGTVGLAPLPGERWNVTVVVDPDRDGREVAREPGAFLRAFAGERVSCWPGGPEPLDGPWASGPFDWALASPVAGRTVLVGDAAGYYDPLTGQGIGRALLSGELAARAIDTALRSGRVSETALAPYGAALRRALRGGRRVQRLVEAVVSRPGLRAVALRRMGRSSDSLDTLIRVTGDARPALDLLHPAFWVPLLRG